MKMEKKKHRKQPYTKTVKAGRRIAGILAAVCLLGTLPLGGLAESPVKVIIGGERLKTDVPAMIINDRTMLPARAVFENIGATVSYDTAARRVTAVKGDRTVELTIDSDVMLVNGEKRIIDSPAVIVSDRTLVPLRACAEAFDLPVEWNSTTRTAKVKKPVSVESEKMVSGTPVKYTYDEAGRLLREVWEDQRWTTYTYDENGNCIYEEDEKGERTTYTYDAYGILLYMEEHNGNKYTFDVNGNVIRQDWLTVGSWIQSTYDAAGRKLKTEYSDGLIYTWEYEENGSFKVEVWQGDFFYQWYKELKDEDGKVAHCEYSHGGWIDFTYDENGNLIYTEGNPDGVEFVWSKYTYNEDGDIIEKAESTGYWEKYTYDENGYLQYKECSDGSWTKYVVITR